jgi:hypothetical protein
MPILNNQLYLIARHKNSHLNFVSLIIFFENLYILTYQMSFYVNILYKYEESLALTTRFVRTSDIF